MQSFLADYVKTVTVNEHRNITDLRVTHMNNEDPWVGWSTKLDTNLNREVACFVLISYTIWTNKMPALVSQIKS